ncbi:MAG: hypothetical protein HQ530_00800 [Parcubacteria group bacterium]|nr:hypothetical protein [Parcubacteria group bacterium]
MLESIGRDESLDEDEKEKRKYRLKEEYKDSIVLEKLVKTEAVNSLLVNLMNPYNVTDHSTSDELIYDPGYETETTYSDSDKAWRSHWDPDVHHRKGSGKYLSPETVTEIQKGLELYFQMRDNVLEIKGHLREQDTWQHDSKAAQAIIDKYFQKDVRLQGRAEVLFGPVSVTCILYDKDDLAEMYGEDDASEVGGFHHPYDIHSIYSHEGVVNMVRGGGYFRSAESVKRTIAHENEHSLNEILVKNRGGYRAISDIVKKGYQPVRQEMKEKGDASEVSEETIKKAVEKIAAETIGEATGRALKGFANETLAYMLNDERSADETFETLTESDLYAHHRAENLKDKVMNRALGDGYYSLDKEIKLRAWEHTWLFPPEKENNEYYLETGPELFARFSQTYVDMRDSIESDITTESVKQTQRGIVDAVDSLLKRGLEKNEIRALLSGESPTRWPRIVEKFKGYDQGELRERTLIEKQEKKIRSKERRHAGRRSYLVGRIIKELTRDEWEEEEE